jgi:hypothetical protein
MSNDS